MSCLIFFLLLPISVWDPHRSTCRGFNEALNGFADDGWSMINSDGMDDVTILVNSSPGKMMSLNLGFVNGFPSTTNSVLCAKASMLLQVGI